MKYIFFISIIFFALSAQANDTLTRAQVYNFSVGDTFDYRNYVDDYGGGECANPPYSNVSIRYTRYVIANIFYSADSSIKYIQRQQIFPQPVVFDTLVIQNPPVYEVFADTIDYYCYDLVASDTSQYHGRTYNLFWQYPRYPYHGSPNELEFVEGLGMILSGVTFGAYGCYTTDTTTLIYYHQGSETWGTPYSNFLTGIQSLSMSSGQISLFPTINNGAFNAKITNATLLPVNFALYDITGRQVKQLTLNNQNNNINIEPCNSGMYIWKAISLGQLIETGKIVVQ